MVGGTMIAAAAELLAVTLSVLSAPAGACDAGAMLRERAESILPTLDKAKQTAAAGIERGAGATETIDNLQQPIGRSSWPFRRVDSGGRGERVG